MTIEKKFAKVFKKIDGKNMCYYAIQVKKGDCHVNGLDIPITKKGHPISAIIHYEEGGKQITYGMVNGIYYKYGDFDQKELLAVNVAIDQSDIYDPQAYLAIAFDTTSPLTWLELSQDSEIKHNQNCTIYWETEDFAQLTSFGYNLTLNTMQCSIQTIRDKAFVKQFFEQTLWNVLPQHARQYFYLQNNPNEEELSNGLQNNY